MLRVACAVLVATAHGWSNSNSNSNSDSNTQDQQQAQQQVPTLSWVIPMNPDTKTVTVGDKLKFSWTGNHNVYESASKADYDSCAKSGGTMLATTAVNTYEHTFSTAGTYYFICEVGGHCNAGQKIAITVQAAAGPDASPPPAAAASPSPSPPPVVVTSPSPMPPPPSPPMPPPPCFASDALVTRVDGTSARMDALSPGDEILAATASGTVTTGYISVFSIAKPNAANVAHVHLTTDSNATLTLTPAHHVPVGSACCSDLKTAGSIAPGDVVWLLHGGATAASAQRVVSTDLAIGDKLGLYSPVLTNGAFPIVDGFVTSFDAIAPVRVASYLLAPFEAMCVATGTCDAFRRAFFGAAGVADGKIVGGAAAAAAVFMPLSAAA